MFGKKCGICNGKISNSYSFCPHCGNSTKKSKNKEFGMLGENDFDETNNLMGNSFFEKIGGKMINKVFENTIKMIENEMAKEMKNQPLHQNQPKGNFQLFINGKRVNLGHPQPIQEKKVEEEIRIELPNGPLKDFKILPKKEPKTNLRRFSDKVTYEVSMPGIKSDKDISIVNLENSIEIKGVGKEVAYQKILPVSLPVTGYSLSKGKLVIELGLKD